VESFGKPEGRRVTTRSPEGGSRSDGGDTLRSVAVGGPKAIGWIESHGSKLGRCSGARGLADFWFESPKLWDAGRCFGARRLRILRSLEWEGRGMLEGVSRTKTRGS
jgi:hypothetical protein